MSNNEFTIRLDPEQIQELKDFIASLETTTTPQPQPKPPAVGVTVEELARILDAETETIRFTVEELARILVAETETIRFADTSLCAAEELLNHPRLGPLLRGEGRRRVELPEKPPTVETPPWTNWCGRLSGSSWQEGHAAGWAAARAELARQQGVG